MRPVAFIVILVQALLTEAVVVLSIWSRMPRLATVGFALLGASALAAASVRPGPWRERVRSWGGVVGWVCTLVVLASVLFAAGARATLGSYFDTYYVTLAWIIAAAAWLASSDPANTAQRARWRWLTMTWLILGGVLWLGASYLHDQLGAFYVGLLVVLALLVLCHFWLRLNTAGVLVVNTLILLGVGLPVADLVVRGADWLRAAPDPRNQYYLYSNAKKDPVAFGHWWNYYVAQWRQVERRLYLRDPDLMMVYRLRPNSHVRFAQGVLSVNSLGFRGKEFPREKGNAYRIVALGESTTFGITLTPGDQTWPELLEQMIRQRLKLGRPVQIINAGIPGYRLDQSLERFRRDILPLKPDMVISYHGINGFKMLKNALPPLPGARPPAYKDRPVRLLADVEYRLKLATFQDRHAPEPAPRMTRLADPMATPYAKLYRQLVKLTATNHIRLVLATFSMAVNAQSDPDVVRFYQAGYPRAAWQVQANILHSEIVRQIAAQHSEVTLVDTHPHLDGDHDKFIDLVHFDAEGRHQLAKTFFAALKPILETSVK